MPQRSYKYRFYPTTAQENQLAACFGHARYVWNRMLHLRSSSYERWGISLNFADTSAQLTCLKQAKPWLYEVPSSILVQKLQDLDRAFSNFFQGRAKFPRFKRKDGPQSVRFQLDQRHIAKTFVPGEKLVMPGLGEVKLRWSRVPGGIPKMATLSRDAAGRYFVSVAVEETIAALPVNPARAGLDLGVAAAVTASDGYREANPRHLRQAERRLKRAQRALSRTQKGSNRRRRAKAKVAKLHARVADTRQDWQHQVTTRLIRRYGALALEDLNPRGMTATAKGTDEAPGKNVAQKAGLNRALLDVGFGEIGRQLAYKAAWYGREVRYADRWYPSSKTCSCCGKVQKAMPLQIRSWTCPDCGATHDRDENAARNLLHHCFGSTPGRGERQGRGACTNPIEEAA